MSPVQHGKRFWERPPWPTRSFGWACLAGLILPASVLSRAEAVYYLFPPLALSALLLRAPPGRLRWSIPAPLLWPCLAFFAWALVTVLWTPEPLWALRRWSATFAMVLLTVASCTAALAATDAERRSVYPWLVLGFLAAAALLLIDSFGGAWISRQLFGQASVRDVHNQAARSLFLFALAAFALASRQQGLARTLPVLAVLALSAVLHHWAGVLGIVAACMVWAAASWNGTLMRRAWIPLLLAVVLLSPLQGLLLQLVPDTGWKPRELVVREQIWRFAAERALEKPIFGWGLEATRAIPNYGETTLLAKGGRILSNHPHNVPLQLWMELGLPGLALGGWLLFRLQQRVREPLAQAVLLNILVFAVLSAGFWRPRWMALACCGALLYCLVAPRAKQPEEAAGGAGAGSA
jgi:hypothetical protein